MNDSENRNELVRIGLARLQSTQNREPRGLSGDPEADRYLKDIQNYPHIYVLACLMDKQIKAERAWLIPFEVCSHFGAFTMQELANLSAGQIESYFLEYKPHRFNKDMARVFYEGIQRIHTVYADDASRIWSDTPSSAAVVYRFLQFAGAGIKIATMATNILVREYHVPLRDYYSIDISPDLQVKRIFYRTGLVENTDDVNLIIYKARELYPIFPGVIDESCWEIGRTYCRPTDPNCAECPLADTCQKILD